MLPWGVLELRILRTLTISCLSIGMSPCIAALYRAGCMPLPSVLTAAVIGVRGAAREFHGKGNETISVSRSSMYYYMNK